MMPQRPGCLILETSGGWQLTTTGSANPPSADVEVESAADLAESVAAFVETHRLRRDRLLIAPQSNSVLFATFPVGELAASRDRRTMAFRLEGSLPFDAEQTVADFLVGERLVSSVSVNGDALLPIVTALEERGLLVQSIVPAAILACQSLVRHEPHVAEGLILWQETDRCEWLRLSEGQLDQWRHLPAGASVLSRELTVQQLDAAETPAVMLVDMADELADELQADCPGARRITTDGLAESARRFAGQVLSGSQTPWFELRRDRLANGDPYRAYRPAVSWLMGAAAAFVIVLAIAWGARAARLQQRFTEIKQQQRDLFERTFPQSPIPRAIVSRIHSEHAKMIGSRQMNDDVPRSHSALDVLHGFLTGRPTALRSRFTEIRVENGVLTADIELRSHDDAGVVAACLEQSGFSVDPPTTTQRDEKTVVTRLQARWTPDDEAADAASRPEDSGGSS